ncbi:hypothetical protein TNCV_4428991 [Trichonephila clavipes]|nr:hypothetical protein TNCV_4428991 [Trichonephila clavipes]
MIYHIFTIKLFFFLLFIVWRKANDPPHPTPRVIREHYPEPPNKSALISPALKSRSSQQDIRNPSSDTLPIQKFRGLRSLGTLPTLVKISQLKSFLKTALTHENEETG